MCRYEWIEPFLSDDTILSPFADSKRSITFQEFVTDLFSENKYFPTTVLRRIPASVLSKIEYKNTERDVFRERCERGRKYIRRGTKCKCKYGDDGVDYDIEVNDILPNKNFLVTYVEYPEQQHEVNLLCLLSPLSSPLDTHTL